MDKISKRLEQALTALQLANNEIARTKIMKRPYKQTETQAPLLGNIEAQIKELRKNIAG